MISAFWKGVPFGYRVSLKSARGTITISKGKVVLALSKVVSVDIGNESKMFRQITGS